MQMVWRSYGVEAREYVKEKSGQAKRECYGKHSDYKLVILKQIASEISPFRPNLKQKYADRRKRFDKRITRHWSLRPCFCCQAEGPRHVHHIVPLAHGGTNDHCNLIMLCVPCHSYVHGFEVVNK